MNKRISFFDGVRGFTMISMALFHATYDLAYINGMELPWFTQGSFQDIWRASISWVFLFIAGWMCSLSRNNGKRALKYAAAAALVWVATTVASVDDSVNFGIIFCMAASTALFVVAEPLLERIPWAVGMLSCLVLFTLTWSVPRTVYPVPGLAWLGFPSPGFVSGDYYPMVPFTFMFLAGWFASKGMRGRAFPQWMQRGLCKPLESLGRHALPFYLLHQPIILGVIELVYSVR